MRFTIRPRSAARRVARGSGPGAEGVEALLAASRAAGWPESRATTSLLRSVALALGEISTPVVAVVAEQPAGHPLIPLLKQAYPTARVTALARPQGLAGLHLQLAAAGRFDLVVDLSRADGAVGRLTLFVFHTSRGGAVILRLPRGRAAREKWDAFVLRLASALTAGDQWAPTTTDDQRDPRSAAEVDWAALVTSVGSVRERPGHVIVEVTADASVKVREEQIGPILALRGGGRVLESSPATTTTSRCSVRGSDTEWLDGLPAHYLTPALSVREYADVLCVPGQQVILDNLVLPETFRHVMQRRLRNKFLAERGRDFVSAPSVSATPLAGQWFYLDNEHRGHFGHVMTEQLSHLWGWGPAKARNPDLKALVSLNRGRQMASWEYELLAAGGVDRADILMVSEPVRVESLVSATPMFGMPHFIHHEIRHTWSMIGDSLARRAPQRDYPDRIFASRRIQKRWCHNNTEVEQFFADNGFEIIYPEDHSLPEQVALFRNASLVAGYSGSGMFQLMFCTEAPKHVILVLPTSYPAKNEYMMASVLGHSIDFVLCTPDIAREEVAPGQPYVETDFSLDFEHEGVFLKEILSGL